jgi:hypothetical protein
VDIGFLSRQWRQLVQHKTGTGVGIHRQSFEVAVFSYLADQIRSGDIAVVGSEDFADYRTQLLSWDECEKLLPEYCKKAGLPQTKDGFVNDLRSKLEQAAKQLDQRYPSAGDDLVINSKGVPVVKRVTKREIPESALQLEAEIAKRMPTRNVIDVLTNIQHWTDFTRHFGPISKNETKLSNPTEKYLMTVFANGTNLGPTQAARHFAKQQASAATLSYVNKRHVTKEGLEARLAESLGRRRHCLGGRHTVRLLRRQHPHRLPLSVQADGCGRIPADREQLLCSVPAPHRARRLGSHLRDRGADESPHGA